MRAIVCFLVCFALALPVSAAAASKGLVETFDSPLAKDPEGRNGWGTLTGDGEATMTFDVADGKGIVTIDASKDRRNIWWAIIKREATRHIDTRELFKPGRELRIEARIRLSDAPRRVNLSINHTRTTDFHANLAEYDIPDTGWHTISFTTTKPEFDARPGDEIFAQLALIDAGRAVYKIEIDNFKVTVVDPITAGPDLGERLPYRPEAHALSDYAHSAAVIEDATIDAGYPWVNFKDWSDHTMDAREPLLAIGSAQTALLRFDFAGQKDKTPDGWGVLVLTTQNVSLADIDLEEFGYLRTVEIQAGDPAWTRDTVTYDSFFGGKPWLDVLNGQLMIDLPPVTKRGEKMLIPVSPPVLKRLLSGETKGLAIYAQGAVSASYYSGRASHPGRRPKLYFNTK